MKILLVNDYSTPTGGAEIQVLNLRAELRRRGHDVRLFAGTARPAGSATQADYDCAGTLSGWRTPLQAGNPWAYARLRQVLAEFQPDIVHVVMFLTQLSPWILPLLAGTPSLLSVVWYRLICPLGTKTLPDGSSCRNPAGAACVRCGCLPVRDWLLLLPALRLSRHWLDKFDTITVMSDFIGQALLEQGIGPVETVWGGVPTVPCRPPLDSVPTVVFAGRLVPEKGVEMLIQAFRRVAAEVPQARLVIAGDGPERARLKQLAAETGLAAQIEMTGHLPTAQMEALFASAWVQAVPSRWAEPFGLVAAEAMMRGTAVVASAEGGLAEIVQNGRTGFLVPPERAEERAEEWAEPLTALLKSRDLAETMGQAGRQRALSEFSIDVCADRFFGIYERLCQKENVH